MGHERLRIASEEPLDQLSHHRAAHQVLGHGGVVDELSPQGAVGDDALVLHLAEHRRDGGRREAALLAQRLVHLGAGRFAALPEHPHDRVLQVPQGVAWHVVSLSTTKVELPW